MWDFGWLMKEPRARTASGYCSGKHREPRPPAQKAETWRRAGGITVGLGLRMVLREPQPGLDRGAIKRLDLPPPRVGPQLGGAGWARVPTAAL